MRMPRLSRSPLHRPIRTALASALTCTLLLAAHAGAQPARKDIIRPEDPNELKAGQPRPIEILPPVPDADAAKKPTPYAERIEVKGPDGKVSYVYKCGDEFTDSPVCTPPVKPSTMRATPEEMQRCKTLRSGNFVPWYCR
jgi:hypothetical protein